jgi:S1-C subfamily serine protease
VPGRSVPLTFYRGSGRRTVAVLLTTAPSPA